MITFVVEIKDLDIFKNYWLPLVCRHREVQFIFCKIENDKLLDDWTNVFFAPSSEIKDVIPYAKNNIVYVGQENEIPTYQLMVKLRKPKEGIVPKIHNTNEDSNSFTVLKNKYPNYERKDIDVSTYVV